MQNNILHCDVYAPCMHKLKMAMANDMVTISLFISTKVVTTHNAFYTTHLQLTRHHHKLHPPSLLKTASLGNKNKRIRQAQTSGRSENDDRPASDPSSASRSTADSSPAAALLACGGWCCCFLPRPRPRLATRARACTTSRIAGRLRDARLTQR